MRSGVWRAVLFGDWSSSGLLRWFSGFARNRQGEQTFRPLTSIFSVFSSLRVSNPNCVCKNQDHGKGGFEFKGGSLHDGFGGFDGLGGSGEHPTLLLLVLQNTAQWGNHGGSDGFRRSWWFRSWLCKKGKGPHPQDKIQHLDFTKDPRPLYYSLCILPQNVCSKTVFGP